MKKLIIFALLIIAPMMSYAQGGKLRAEIGQLIRQYDARAEFEVVKLGKFAMSLMRFASDREEREAYNAIKHVESITIVEYDDCRWSVKNEFNNKLKSLLSKAELIMEVQDDGDQVYVYGRVTDNTVEDLILFTPSENALICFFGKVYFEDINVLMDFN